MVGKKYELLTDCYIFTYEENYLKFKQIAPVLYYKWPYFTDKKKIGRSYEGVVLLGYLLKGTNIEIVSVILNTAGSYKYTKYIVKDCRTGFKYHASWGLFNTTVLFGLMREPDLTHLKPLNWKLIQYL